MASSYNIIYIFTASLLIHLSYASLKTSCKATSYPKVCEQTLAAYSSLAQGSPRQLAEMALSLSARRAREASTYVSMLSSRSSSPAADNSGYSVYYDCMVTMSDSAARLSKSIVQLRKLGRKNRPSFGVRLGNVVTWVSAALTDQNMCIASLVEGINGKTSSNSMHGILRNKVIQLSMVTSNALSLVNKLGNVN